MQWGDVHFVTFAARWVTFTAACSLKCTRLDTCAQGVADSFFPAHYFPSLASKNSLAQLNTTTCLVVYLNRVNLYLLRQFRTLSHGPFTVSLYRTQSTHTQLNLAHISILTDRCKKREHLTFSHCRRLFHFIASRLHFWSHPQSLWGKYCTIVLEF